MDVNQFKQMIVEPALSYMAEIGFIGADNPAAVNLMVGTAWQESRLKWLKQQPDGPALGIYQIEPATAADVWKNYIHLLKDDREKYVMDILPCYIALDDTDYINENLAAMMMVWQLQCNLQYATTIARLIYYRQKFEWPAPDDIPALGRIWKQFYNTEKGAGTVREFVENFPIEILIPRGKH